MFKLSKLNIAKQKILELNKKYSKPVIKNSSDESNTDLRVKGVREYSNSIASNTLHLERSTKNDKHESNMSSQNDSTQSSKISELENEDHSSTISLDTNKDITIQEEVNQSETMLNVELDKKTSDIRNITPTGVSKLLANVFIISSSDDDEELSEEIHVGRITDRAKSYTSTSARTVSEDIMSEEGNKRSTPRSIKFLRIDTPILAAKEQDDRTETCSSGSNEESLTNIISVKSETSMSKIDMKKQIKLKDKYIDYKLNSNSTNFHDSLKSNEQKKNADNISCNSKEFNNEIAYSLQLKNRNVMDVSNSSKRKKRTISKGIQTNLQPLPHHINKINWKYTQKMNKQTKVQKRPILQPSSLYRFSDMTKAEINCLTNEIFDIEDFSEDKSGPTLELLVQQFLKQQVVIIRNLVESHHKLYLNYCNSVQQMCRSGD